MQYNNHNKLDSMKQLCIGQMLRSKKLTSTETNTHNTKLMDKTGKLDYQCITNSNNKQHYHHH